MTPSFVAGNIVEAAVTLTPETGTVALADVTAKLRKADGTEVALTGITSPGTNQFEVEWASADTDITGRYVIRWESNTPSAKIVREGADTTFILIASVFATP